MPYKHTKSTNLQIDLTKGARQKNNGILSGPWPPPLAVSGQSGFMQVIFNIYIYVFETRKAWNGWFWKKEKNLVLK